MASTVKIFTKLLITQQHYVEIFYTELRLNQSGSTESMAEISLRSVESTSLTLDRQHFVKTSTRNFMQTC